MLISTDGIFGGMNIHQITDFIMENCKIVNPDCDNMSVILIIIRKGQVK